MVRAKWAAILVVGLTWSGLCVEMRSAHAANGPQTFVVAEPVPQTITVSEPGKLAAQCRVLKSWKTADGLTFEVEVVSTGERMTIVESGPIYMHGAAVPGNGKIVEEMRSRIYRWAHNEPPPGCPRAPMDASVPASLACGSNGCKGVSPGPVRPVPAASPYASLEPAAAPVVSRSAMPTPYAPAASAPPQTGPVVAPPVTLPVASAPATLPVSAPVTVPVLPAQASVPAPVPPATVAVMPATPEASGPAVEVPAGPAVVADTAEPKQPETPKATPAKREKDWHLSWAKPGDKKEAAKKADPSAPYESHMPEKEDLPQAAKGTSDPINDPAPFSPYDLKDKYKDVKDVDADKNDAKDTDKKDDKDSPAGEKKSDADKDRDQKKDAVEADKKPAHPLLQRFKDMITIHPGDKKNEARQEVSAEDNPEQHYFMLTPNGQLVPVDAEAAHASQISAATTAALETDPSNAFTAVKRAPVQAQNDPGVMGNAFTGGAQPAMQAYRQMGMPPGYPPMPYQQPMGQLPNAYGYAGQPMGQMPQPYGYAGQPMGQMPQPYGYPGMSQPMMYHPPMDRGNVPSGAVVPAGHTTVSSRPDTQQLLLVLRSSLYPSHRELAADQLGKLDARSNPIVVELMAQAAKNDPAASVRSACVRNLCQMNASTPVVAETFIAMQQSDENPAVREAVARAMSELHIARQPAPSAPAVQPAGLR
jgi:hypothetical protein